VSRIPGPDQPIRLGARGAVAAGVTRAVNAVSRLVGAGGGTVAGGRAGLAIDPSLLQRLTRGRAVALVSGTNGKTTTTRLLAVALEADGASVVTNATGANMPAGHAAALVAGGRHGPVVLEVDEAYVPELLTRAAPAAVVLLNLSRDQLDRTNEVRMLAGRWRRALDRAPVTVVANADDPLVVWGTGAPERVVWVGAGLRWHNDATGCPSCGGRITFDGAGWRCPCGFARPALDLWREGLDGGAAAVWADGTRRPLELDLPGRFNEANALMAVAAAEVFGAGPAEALAAMGAVAQVAGRFTTPVVAGVPTRLLLAKNPAGWSELLDLVAVEPGPVVVGINARVADGADPSWLYDVPFELLRDRPVVATGERRFDLSVRLHYAEVAHRVEEDPLGAIGLAAGPERSPVEFIGNYTAFHDVLRRV
jgi:UDP-N-acetylmuramyl tripeptide synthase